MLVVCMRAVRMCIYRYSRTADLLHVSVKRTFTVDRIGAFRPVVVRVCDIPCALYVYDFTKRYKWIFLKYGNVLVIVQ